MSTKFSTYKGKINKDGRNTAEKGLVEFTIFKEDDRYVGVCLTFDIVVEGDDFEKVRRDIIDAARVHIETVRSKNLSENLLNRPAPKELWDKKSGSLHMSESGVERHSYSLDKKGGLLATI